MLVVEDKPLLDVDVMADIQTMRKNPLWWKPPDESLGEKLLARVAGEKNKKRVPQKS